MYFYDKQHFKILKSSIIVQIVTRWRLIHNLERISYLALYLCRGRTSGCRQRERIQVPFDICTCIQRKNFDLTHIHDEALINITLRKLTKLRMCRYQTLKSDRVSRVPQNNSEEKHNSRFSSSKQI